ncbi:MAG: 50S ribosomal protein L35ae [Candidatus Woesearchaeota archaeon]
MEAKIASFKRGRKTQTPNQAIVIADSVQTGEDAQKLVGKKVTYTTPSGKTISGEIRAIHGKNGQVRVLFEKGIPGQAITQKVTIA